MTGNEAAVAPGRDERLLKWFVLPNGGQRRETLAVRRRRLGRQEERTTQTKLARMLASYLDRSCTFWTSLENRPRSALAGALQRRQGCKSGLPDVVVVQQQSGRLLIVFVELKSPGGLASKTQKQVRAELLAAGAAWWMPRSARAAMTALYRSGVEFHRPWEPSQLEPWEGPFSDPTQRLPQAPDVAAYRRAAQRRYRERRRARDAAQRAASTCARRI